MNGQIDGKHSRHHIWSAAWQDRGVQRLENFLSTDKPEHHSIDRLKETGVEKGSGRHSTLKAENDLCSTRQILALFRGQPWETAERWGGARMGLSERYDAILS